ncbi:hypothetical protein Q7378_02825 [Glaesserella parasuis]|uniref:hypothetical protein n=1 Tax=Glaesserella parasuis TaxID=738 RepID=UPI000DD3900B|nr:hypothetical protein [Glaesserella parasuis]MDG6325790.1 hypothetical protein [Glaesserella parasuis]MDO9923719.1 hypothetical protein [Glaesserella parasuis]MDP0017359.1 hypothetical protein [Glaesserella parasuis]MDP0053459.1 hypothetical protein [Glaesserella parasuis]MDP0070723.1 hypothetical protein [Glaesserella parasuis]
MTEQTTQKKYELLKDDTVEHFGRTLYRIKALITFGLVGAGQLGGYIETEKNLDHSGNAWVYDNALVYGDARVCGDALVRSFAVISERKMIFGASNVGSENGTLTVFNGKYGLIVTRGCFTGTVDEFLSKSKEVHDDKTHHEYKLLIEVAQSRILN